eukprot:854093-Prorocentrum_minimum.AAC.1
MHSGYVPDVLDPFLMVETAICVDLMPPGDNQVAPPGAGAGVQRCRAVLQVPTPPPPDQSHQGRENILGARTNRARGGAGSLVATELASSHC